MAKWVCGFDESSDQNPRKNFLFIGVSAPEADWETFFRAAWNERVLNGPPAIPYLHMVDIRDGDWQRKYGLSQSDARRRVDEAANVIQSMGSLLPVCVWVDEADYSALLRQDYQPQPGQTKEFDPDFMCFLYVSFVQLNLLREDHGSDITRLDFWVENNGKVTHHVGKFHAAMAAVIKTVGGADVAPLVGEFKRVDKSAIPAQVADVIAWHARNFENGTLDRAGFGRYWKMRRDGVGGSRGFWRQMQPDFLKELAAGFAAKEAEERARGGC